MGLAIWLVLVKVVKLAVPTYICYKLGKVLIELVIT